MSSKITHASHRAVAISGIVHAIRRRLNLSHSDFVCGLWNFRFADGLMWFPRNKGPSLENTRPESDEVSTCSWLSVEIGMLSEHSGARHHTSSSQTVAEVLGI